MIYIIIGIVLFALLLGITSATIDDQKNLNFFEKAIKDTTTFVQKIFYAPIKYVKGELEVFNEKKEVMKYFCQIVMMIQQLNKKHGI